MRLDYRNLPHFVYAEDLSERGCARILALGGASSMHLTRPHH
jgi:hypothetical protein